MRRLRIALELAAAPRRRKGVLLPRVAVEGEFQPRYTVYLDNKTRRGKAGYEIVTRCGCEARRPTARQRAGSMPSIHATCCLIADPSGEVRIEGMRCSASPGVAVQGKRTAVRQSLDIEAYAAETA